MASYKWKQLKEIIANTKNRHRDFLLEDILKKEEEVSINQQFINEVRDHLSTCVNKKDFYSDEYFVDIKTFIIENDCGCKTHYESEKDFWKNMSIIYLLYEGKNDFMAENYLQKSFIEKLKQVPWQIKEEQAQQKKSD